MWSAVMHTPPAPLWVFSTHTRRVVARCTSRGLTADSMSSAVSTPRGACTVVMVTPASEAQPPTSHITRWARSSAITSSRGRQWVMRAQALPWVPLVTNSAAGLSNSSATYSSSLLTVGSSPDTSSPTSASAMARRMESVGSVMVSLRSSMGFRVIGPRVCGAGGRRR